MKRNPLGSIVFDTTTIRTEEYILLAECMVKNGSSVEHAALEITALDDMLSLQRIHSIITNNRFTATGRLRKNSSLLDLISKRLDQLIIDMK